MAQLTSTYLIRGGLNVATPALAVPAGQLIGARNYEMDVRGARRMDGYERYDGRPRPSEASYWVLDFDGGTAAILEDQTVTGATSGATGIAVIDAVVETGSYGGSDAAGYLVLYNVTGTFQDNENLQVSAATKCQADGTDIEHGASTDADGRTWLRSAIAKRRASITAVPGSGSVRGSFVLNGDVYAIRDNAGGTAGVLHKATTSGWSAQSLGHYLLFDAGTAAFNVGATLTGGTSGATATIRRVVLSSGAWDGSAAGILTLSGITGTFQDNEAITDNGSAAGAGVANGTQVANTLPAGGRYDTIIRNFYGSGYSERAYCANGVGRAFEWDGTYFTPIRTGLTDALDKPDRISELANHLFLHFAGGSVQFSSIGEPLQYLTTTGAGELSFGSDVTNFLSATSTAMVVLGRNKAGYIAGTDADSFVLNMVSGESGGVSWTLQNLGGPVYLDDGGVRRMSTTQAFGDWRIGTMTQAVEPLFATYERAGITAVGSVRNKAKDIYRLFYSDGTALSLYLGAKNPESMLLDLPVTVSCTATGNVGSEEYESIFVGGEDGYLYEMDRGTSFDGAQVDAYVRMAFNSVGSPTQRKRWHKITLDCDVSEDTTLHLISDFAYSNPYQPAAGETDFSVTGGGGLWDLANWNQFVWSAQVVGQAECHIDGLGQNLSAIVISEATHEEPHTLSAVTLNFSYRGMIR
jgi:hypothetical protein